MIELLISLALLAMLAMVVIASINPIEQLKKAQDMTKKTYAGELLRAIERFQVTQGKNPNLTSVTPSLSCQEIIDGEPVTDIGDLKYELSSWFPGRIYKPENYLYVGLLPSSGIVKICYRVESISSMTRVQQSGCLKDLVFYLCLPE